MRGCGEDGAGEADELALARARGSGRAAAASCRSRPPAAMMKSCAPTASAASIDLLVGRVRAAVGDVLAHGAGEQVRLLQHDAHVARQRAPLDVADVVAVDADGAARDLVAAADERRDRRLAGAGVADEGDRLARLHVQVDVLEDRHALDVVEVDVVEVDAALDRLELDGVRPVDDAQRACPAPRRCARRRPSRAGTSCTASRGRGSGRRSACT